MRIPGEREPKTKKGMLIKVPNDMNPEAADRIHSFELETIIEDENASSSALNQHAYSYESPNAHSHKLQHIKSTGKLVRKKAPDNEDSVENWTPKKLTFGEVYVCEFYKKRPPSDLPPISPRGDRLYVKRRSERLSKSASGPSRNLQF